MNIKDVNVLFTRSEILEEKDGYTMFCFSSIEFCMNLYIIKDSENVLFFWQTEKEYIYENWKDLII